jgi:uncharacterized protein (DUF1697 family)
MLRGINVGDKRKVDLEDLKHLFGSIGLQNAFTYAQSGNVVFDAQGSDGSQVERKIERELLHRFALDITVIVRSSDELRVIVKNNPFAGMDSSALHVTFLSREPAADPPIDDIERLRAGAEDFLFSGKEVYLFCPYGYGKTKLSNQLFERKLKVMATTRNWRTVNTLLSMAND